MTDWNTLWKRNIMRHKMVTTALLNWSGSIMMMAAHTAKDLPTEHMQIDTRIP